MNPDYEMPPYMHGKKRVLEGMLLGSSVIVEEGMAMLDDVNRIDRQFADAAHSSSPPHFSSK